MKLEILDEVFKSPEGTFFDSVTLTVTPDYGESTQEITIASDRLRPDCLYASILNDINSTAYEKECVQY